jgi:hypothetical protein
MRFVPLMAFLCAGALAQTPAPAPASAFSGIEEAVAQLSKITGFRPVKKVQYDTITKAQFKIYLGPDDKHRRSADRAGCGIL